MFWSTSTSSRVLKQAATPAKLQEHGVGGLTNANALASGGDLSRDEALGLLGGGLNGMVLVVRRTLLFTHSMQWLAGELPLWLSLVGRGVLLYSTWCNLELPFQVGKVSTVAVAPGVSAAVAVGDEGLFSSSLGRSTPQKTSSSIKER